MSPSLTMALALALLATEKVPVAPEVDLTTMVHFETASFEMGWENATPGPYGDGWFIDQQPLHSVSVEAFHLDRHEVTVADFARFLTHAAGDYYFDGRQPGRSRADA